VLRTRIWDPRSGAILNPGSGIGKKSGSGSGMNNPDHTTESLETIFWVNKKLKFFNKDPGWKKFESGMKKFGSGIRNEKIRIRDKHPGSTTLQLIEKKPCVATKHSCTKE
jgi:hypothetical protein